MRKEAVIGQRYGPLYSTDNNVTCVKKQLLGKGMDRSILPIKLKVVQLFCGTKVGRAVISLHFF